MTRNLVVTILGALAILLVVANAVLFEGNRALQGDVSRRAQYLQQTTSIEALGRDIATALANFAVQANDDRARALLAEHGVTVGPAPSPAGGSPARPPSEKR